jgi:hypothetical protein
MPAVKMRSFIVCLLIPFTIVLTAMLINGCGGGGSTSSSPPAPNISLSQVDTDFGAVVVDKSYDKQVSIRNTGNDDLNIGQIAQQNLLNNPFAITIDDCSGATVSPSSSCRLVIKFSPTTQADYVDSFDIPSNDSDEGVLTATLRGNGRFLNVTIGHVGTIDPLLQTVMLIVSVTDRNDAPVISLLANNFSLFENGSPKGIFSFSNVINAPVSVGLVLDYSSSTIPFTAELEAAAKSFIDLLDPINDEAEVIKFATLIEVMQPFTNDQIALKNSIDATFSGFRAGSRLRDAIWDSIESTSSRSNDRLAIVAVSDGADAQSTRTINEVIQNAIGKNVSTLLSQWIHNNHRRQCERQRGTWRILERRNNLKVPSHPEATPRRASLVYPLSTSKTGTLSPFLFPFE